ncbi:MAG: DUF4832 domain-containing protein [Clostridiales bacterium]|nr:DUF4832 domain-containing protein [Clostridiales bacterium]
MLNKNTFISRIGAKAAALALIMLIILSALTAGGRVYADAEGEPDNVFNPGELSGAAAVFENPLKGWAPNLTGYSAGGHAQPVNMYYTEIQWKNFEPTKGVYNFGSIETNNFNSAKAAGKHLIIRFLLDNPLQTSLTQNTDGTWPAGAYHMEIPAWVYDETVAEFGGDASKAGIYYAAKESASDTRYNRFGFSPNYYSESLLDGFRNAVAALAERYDGDPFIAVAQLGGLGHWGELHTVYVESMYGNQNGIKGNPERHHELVGMYPMEARSREFFECFEAFENKQIVMRYPANIAIDNGWGLYNDYFGIYGEGGVGSHPTYVDALKYGFNKSETGEYTPPYADWWKNMMFGGEISAFSSTLMRDCFTTNTNAANVRNFANTLNQIETQHVTWLGPSTAYSASASGSTAYNASQLANLYTVYKRMGYHFVVSRSAVWIGGEALHARITVANKGVAPFYAAGYSVEVYLLDEEQNILETVKSDADIREWADDSDSNLEVDIPYTVSEEGRYRLGIAIIDDATGLPAIKFGNTGEIASSKRIVLNNLWLTANDTEGLPPDGGGDGDTGGGDNGEGNVPGDNGGGDGLIPDPQLPVSPGSGGCGSLYGSAAGGSGGAASAVIICAGVLFICFRGRRRENELADG